MKVCEWSDLPLFELFLNFVQPRFYFFLIHYFGLILNFFQQRFYFFPIDYFGLISNFSNQNFYLWSIHYFGPIFELFPTIFFIIIARLVISARFPNFSMKKKLNHRSTLFGSFWNFFRTLHKSYKSLWFHLESL